MPQIGRTADFVSSIGVNTHIAYTNSNYVHIGNVVSDLKYIGLSLVRDSGFDPTWDPVGQRNYGVAAAAGIKFDFVVGPGIRISTRLGLFDSFANAHPGSIASFEGPNEINNFPITYNVLTAVKAALAFQNDFYAAAKADPLLAGASIDSFTGASVAPTGGYDAVALHLYPQYGSEPAALINTAKALAAAGGRVDITEMGFSTLPSNSQWGVDNTVQAKELLNAIFDAKAAGVHNIYLYELLDAYADPRGTSVASHYGLFDNNNAPKPAAVALHNLTAILSDAGSTAHTFTTGPFNYAVTNLPSTGSSMVMEKSNGAYDIVVWNEPKIWNAATHSEIAAPSTTVTVSLGGSYSQVELYDPLAGGSPVQILHNVSQVSVALTDHPLIIQIDPGGSTLGQFNHAWAA